MRKSKEGIELARVAKVQHGTARLGQGRDKACAAVPDQSLGLKRKDTALQAASVTALSPKASKVL